MVVWLLRAAGSFLVAAGVLTGLSFTAFQIGDKCVPTMPSEWCVRFALFYGLAEVAIAVAALLAIVAAGRLVWLWFTPLTFRSADWVCIWRTTGDLAVQNVSYEPRQHIQYARGIRSYCTVSTGWRNTIRVGREGLPAELRGTAIKWPGREPVDGQMVAVRITVRPPWWLGRTVHKDGFPNVRVI